MRAPCIIAEIGVNYYDVSKKLGIPLIHAAKEMIFECKKAGVNAVKFQTYKADKLAANHSPSYWDQKEEPITSQKELFSKFDKFGEADYKEMAKYCREIDIEFMSTAFDFESADFIDKLVFRHKIASADITNFPLLGRIAKYGKPVILSTGASQLEEIVEAVDFLRKKGCKDLTLLHCILSYPTAVENANLWKIQSLKKHFTDCKIGISDHTIFNLDVLSTAWLLGVTVIEKHVTLDKKLKGNDHYHAGDPDDFNKLSNKIQFLKKIYGEESTNWTFECERDARKNARRGVYLSHDVEKGDKLRHEHVAFLRPQLDGISPKQIVSYIENNASYLVGLEKGTLIKKEYISSTMKISI